MLKFSTEQLDFEVDQIFYVFFYLRGDVFPLNKVVIIQTEEQICFSKQCSNNISYTKNQVLKKLPLYVTRERFQIFKSRSYTPIYMY